MKDTWNICSLLFFCLKYPAFLSNPVSGALRWQYCGPGLFYRMWTKTASSRFGIISANHKWMWVNAARHWPWEHTRPYQRRCKGHIRIRTSQNPAPEGQRRYWERWQARDTMWPLRSEAITLPLCWVKMSNIDKLWPSKAAQLQVVLMEWTQHPLWLRLDYL